MKPKLFIIIVVLLLVTFNSAAQASPTMVACSAQSNTYSPVNLCPGKVNVVCTWDTGAITFGTGDCDPSHNIILSTCICTPPITSNPPTTTQSTLPATSGAALVPYSQKTVNYPSQNSNPTAIANGDVSSFTNTAHLPPCPNDPYTLYTNNTYTSATAINTVVSNNSTPLADINGSLPSGTVTAPPDQCVVRSLVLCGNPATPCTSITTPISSEPIAAVCPDDYVQVGEFDMEPEIVYSTNGSVSSPTNIANFSDYKFYRTQGFGCGIPPFAPITGYLQSDCISSLINGNNQLNTSFEYYINYPAGAPFANPVNIGVIEVPYNASNNPPIALNASNFYPNSSSCTGSTASLSGNVTYQLDTKNVADFAGRIPVTITFNQPGSFRILVPYSDIQCSQPVNYSSFYFSSHLAPRALICAKLQSQYRQINH